MSVIVDIADAVVAELNEHSFSLDFTAERAYLPRYELEEMETLRVTVVPSSVQITTVSRAGEQYDYGIDMGVQKRRTTTDDAELDGLMDLVEEIADHFTGLTLADPAAACVEVVNNPIYAPEHLDEMRQYTSVLTLVFRMWR